MNDLYGGYVTAIYTLDLSRTTQGLSIGTGNLLTQSFESYFTERPPTYASISGLNGMSSRNDASNWIAMIWSKWMSIHFCRLI